MSALASTGVSLDGMGASAPRAPTEPGGEGFADALQTAEDSAATCAPTAPETAAEMPDETPSLTVECTGPDNLFVPLFWPPKPLAAAGPKADSAPLHFDTVARPISDASEPAAELETELPWPPDSRPSLAETLRPAPAPVIQVTPPAMAGSPPAVAIEGVAFATLAEAGFADTLPAPTNETARSYTHRLDTTQPAWPQQLATQLRWSLENGLGKVELRLHPEDLGPVEVRLELEGERARIWMAAGHPMARELLDAALPQLQQQFQNAGLHLVESRVSEQSAGTSQHPARTPGFVLHAGGDVESPESNEPRPSIRRIEGRIDDYA